MAVPIWINKTYGLIHSLLPTTILHRMHLYLRPIFDWFQHHPFSWSFLKSPISQPREDFFSKNLWEPQNRTPNSSYFGDKKTYVSLVRDFCAAILRTASHRSFTVLLRVILFQFGIFSYFENENGKLKLFPKRGGKARSSRDVHWNFFREFQVRFSSFSESQTFIFSEKTGLINFFLVVLFSAPPEADTFAFSFYFHRRLLLDFYFANRFGSVFSGDNVRFCRKETSKTF